MRCALGVLFFVAAALAQASSLERFKDFVRDTQSARADFERALAGEALEIVIPQLHADGPAHVIFALQVRGQALADVLVLPGHVLMDEKVFHGSWPKDCRLSAAAAKRLTPRQEASANMLNFQ